jgi:CheY-like chemotaxis protein
MKILIVDDDPAVVDFFVQVTETLDVDTPDTADSGEEATARVVNSQYDLITLDIRMPGASGLDILSMVRNMCPHAVIALISGQFPDDISEETAHCADVMLEKPVKLNVLTSLIESARSISSELDKVKALDSFNQKRIA